MNFDKTPLNEVKRGKKKASYNKDDIYRILDAVEVCHIAFNYDGKALVQPINFGRKGDKIYIHGSLKNRMTNAIIEAKEACLSVMILDGLKLTRSAFHHSVNYRSAMVFGNVKDLTTNKEKLTGLETIINHFVPHRWEHCRIPNSNELKATKVIEITIHSGSAKITDTPTEDNTFDLDLPYWAGIIPVKSILGNPIPAENLNPNVSTPQHITGFIEKNNY